MSELSGLLAPATGSAVQPMAPFASAVRQNSQIVASQRQSWNNMMQTLNHDIRMVENPAMVLAQYVVESFQSAKAHRASIGVDCKLADAVRLRKGAYTAREISLMGGRNTDVWYPLTDRACRTMLAVLRNIYTEDDHHPVWDIEPTPRASLTPAAAEELADRVMAQLDNMIASGAVQSQEDFDQEIDGLREFTIQQEQDLSKELTRNISTEIRDHFVETGFADAFDAGLDDFVTYPAAILLVADDTFERVRYNSKGVANTKQYRGKKVVNVDPHRFYPSADSTTTQDGSFIVEVRPTTRTQLYEYRQIRGYVPESIDRVLKRYDVCPRTWLDDSGTEDLQGVVRVSAWREDEFIDVIRFCGRVRGSVLLKSKVKKFEGQALEPERSYEVELHVVGDEILYASTPSDPEGLRPYHKTSLFPQPGAFWGGAVPDTAKDMQRICNAALRSVVLNMAFSAAPVDTVDVAQFDPHVQKAPTKVSPGSTMLVNSMLSPNGNRPAYIRDATTPHVDQYLKVIAECTEFAETTLGLPRYLLGEPATGGAARTATGFGQLQSNAATVLRSNVVRLDRNWLEPIVGQFYRMVISETEDDTLKADAQITARGATTMMTRELNRNRLMEALNLLSPYIQSGHIKAEGAMYILQEVIVELGLDPTRFGFDEAVDLLRQQELQQNLQAAGGVAGGVQAGAPAPGVPAPAPAPQGV